MPSGLINGNKLRELRSQCAWSQRLLGKKASKYLIIDEDDEDEVKGRVLAIHHGTISEMEKHSDQPRRMDYLIAIAEALADKLMREFEEVKQYLEIRPAISTIQNTNKAEQDGVNCISDDFSETNILVGKKDRNNEKILITSNLETSHKNYGYDYFVRIVEYIYKTQFSKNLFSVEYEDKFKSFISNSQQIIPLISEEYLQEWISFGLAQQIVLNAWKKLRYLTIIILDNDTLLSQYNESELKHYKSVIEELINLFEGNIERPFGNIDRFNVQATLEPLSDNIMDFLPISLRIIVDDSLSKLTYVNESNSLEIINPVLLIETLQKENKKFRLLNGGWVEPGVNIFEHALHSDLVKSFLGKNTLIEFDNIKINWIASLSPWPPSIDALFLTSTLKNIHRTNGSMFLFPLINIADIGCGTGFLGIFLASMIPTIKKVYYSDSNYKSTKLALSNHYNNKLNSDYIGLSGFGRHPFTKVDNLHLDTIICNAPYIPSFGTKLPLDHPALSGGLLYEMITYFPNVSKSLISCISILGTLELERALQEASSVKNEIIASKWIPFRVRTIEEDNLKYFVEKGNLLDLYEGPNKNTLGDNISEANFADNRGFRYWHQINVHKFSV